MLKEKIIGFEKHLFLPEVRKSAKELDRLLAEKFVEFGSTGDKYNKQQIIDTLDAESELQITATGFDFEQLAGEAVMLTYRAVIKEQGVEKERLSLRTSIWKLIENRWQMLFHQGTPTQDFK
ncbi:MAG: DUF4440 domain-containing protein [candidate division Zixibacteria bacterium]|nr:DUF4440 domain-containing protein [candidate division Zixibacteria bacterium]